MSKFKIQTLFYPRNFPRTFPRVSDFWLNLAALDISDGWKDPSPISILTGLVGAVGSASVS